MNLFQRMSAAIGSLIPVPREIDDRPPVIDPRLDPDFLEAFGSQQIRHFGGSAQTNGDGGLIPWRSALDLAREARLEARHRDTDDRRRVGQVSRS